MHIVLDTETGGLDYRTDALLTGALFALNDKLEVVDELSFAVKQQPGFYVGWQALQVNKINIVEHNKTADDVGTVETQVSEFLSKYKGANPLGHNIMFDLNFVKYQLPKAGWEKMGYRIMDTMIIARFLQDKGVLPIKSASLGNLTKFFGIEHGNAHEARADVEATVKVYRKLLAL